MRRATLLSRLVVGSVLTLSGPGCTVKTAVVEPTVPGIVDDGLEAMTTKQNQARLKTLLDLPDVERASRALAHALISGALDELNQSDRRAELDRLTSEFVLTVSQALAKGTDEHLGPALARQTANVLHQNLEMLLADGVQQDSAAYVSAVTHAFSSTLSASLSEGIRKDTGPALAGAVQDQVLPGVARGIDGELRPVLVRTSREIAREAGLGLSDALSGELGDTIERRFFKRIDGWIADGQGLADELVSQLKMAVVGLILLTLGLGLGLFLLMRKLKRRTLALELVAHAVKDFTQNASDRRVVELIEAKGKQGPGRLALNEFLGQRPQLKV